MAIPGNIYKQVCQAKGTIITSKENKKSCRNPSKSWSDLMSTINGLNNEIINLKNLIIVKHYYENFRFVEQNCYLEGQSYGYISPGKQYWPA